MFKTRRSRSLLMFLFSLLLLLLLSPPTRACPPLLVSNGFVGSSFALAVPFQATSTVFVQAPAPQVGFSTVGLQEQALVNPFASYGAVGVGTVGVPAFSGAVVSPGFSSFGFNPFFRARVFNPFVVNPFAVNPFFRSRAFIPGFGFNAAFNPFFGRAGFRGAVVVPRVVAPRAAVTRTRTVQRLR